MTKTFAIFINLSLCLMDSGNLWSQQFAEIAISTGSFPYLLIQPESKVTESQHNQSKLLMIESNSEITTCLTTIFRDIHEVDLIRIQLVNAQNGNQFYGFKLDESQVYIDDEFGQVLLGDDFTQDDEFNVVRCNGKIHYLINNHIILTREGMSNTPDLHGSFFAETALDCETYMSITYPQSCGYALGVIEENVIFLEPLRIYDIFSIPGNELKIKYMEKYNVENEVIEIIAWPSDPNQSATIFTPLPNYYGLNIKTLDIQGLVSGLYWIEVRGMNKGEKYQFRIEKE